MTTTIYNDSDPARQARSAHLNTMKPVCPPPKRLSIPLLISGEIGPLCCPPPPAQPIFQFKELEVDHERYAAWRAACARDAALLACVRALNAFFCAHQ